jgi:hypothetical protein
VLLAAVFSWLLVSRSGWQAVDGCAACESPRESASHCDAATCTDCVAAGHPNACPTLGRVNGCASIAPTQVEPPMLLGPRERVRYSMPPRSEACREPERARLVAVSPCTDPSVEFRRAEGVMMLGKDCVVRGRGASTCARTAASVSTRRLRYAVVANESSEGTPAAQTGVKNSFVH